MFKKVSLAEDAGMSFEARCKKAFVVLKKTQELLRELRTKNLRYVGDERHEAMRRIFTKLVERYPEKEEIFYEKTWECVLVSTRDMYGTDAVDSAVKTIEVEGGK